MKPFILLLVITFFSLFNSDLNAVITPNSPKAKEAINLLKKLPEYQLLVKEVEAEGQIRIEMISLRDETFDAFWDSTSRTIRINTLKNENINVLICSLLFELHNAKSDKRFKQLYTKAMHGKISKEDYVENVERMEHENALNCSILLEKGIRQGIFSEGVRWPILHNFDDHYKLQQIKEHSHWLAKSYENLAPASSIERKRAYIGTIPKLSSQDKQDVIRYLKIKNNLESISENQALHGIISLKNEYHALESCYLNKGSQGKDCARTNERIKLLEYVFQDNQTFKTLIKDSPIYMVKRR